MSKIDLDSFVADAMADMLRTKSTTIISADPIIEEDVSLDVPTVSITLKPGELSFSSLFGGVPKNMADFGVSLITDVPESFKWHIPSKDDEYVVQLEEAARIVAGVMDNDKILITGPTGSGKSSLVKQVCSVLQLPFIRVNMSADIESAALFGQLVVRDGATVWEDGPVTEAVRYGALLLIDEWELMPPEIAMGMQNLLEENGYLFLKEKPGSSSEKTYKPHPNFRIVCAGNTVGQGDDTGRFSGTMVQNSATLDRFTTTVCLDYLDKEHELSIIRNKTSIGKLDGGRLIKFAGLIRSAYQQQQVNLTMSPRTLINWAAKFVRHKDMRLAFNISFYDKLRESDKKVVNELYTKVFGS